MQECPYTVEIGTPQFLFTANIQCWQSPPDPDVFTTCLPQPRRLRRKHIVDKLQLVRRDLGVFCDNEREVEQMSISEHVLVLCWSVVGKVFPVSCRRSSRRAGGNPAKKFGSIRHDELTVSSILQVSTPPAGKVCMSSNFF